MGSSRKKGCAQTVEYEVSSWVTSLGLGSGEVQGGAPAALPLRPAQLLGSPPQRRLLSPVPGPGILPLQGRSGCPWSPGRLALGRSQVPGQSWGEECGPFAYQVHGRRDWGWGAAQGVLHVPIEGRPKVRLTSVPRPGGGRARAARSRVGLLSLACPQFRWGRVVFWGLSHY